MIIPNATKDIPNGISIESGWCSFSSLTPATISMVPIIDSQMENTIKIKYTNIISLSLMLYYKRYDF